jgi:hypothetical protein
VDGIEIVPDGSGGAILSWEDGRIPATIFAQRINVDGQPLWAVDGVQISPTPTIVIGGAVQPRMFSDNAGGVIITWWNNQVDPNVGHEYLVAERVDKDGRKLWAEPTPITSMTEIGYGFPSTVIADGAGGAIFVTGHGVGSNTPKVQLRASRIDGNGKHLWAHEGVLVSPVDGVNENPKAILDGSGGAYLAWQVTRTIEDKDIVLQRIDGSGRPAWTTPVLLSSTGNQVGPGLFRDGSGGAVVIWSDCRNTATLNDCLFASDIYGQRVNHLGQTYWKKYGIPITASSANQGLISTWDWPPAPAVGIALNTGDYVFAWSDGRNNLCSAASGFRLESRCDIFSMRLAF